MKETDLAAPVAAWLAARDLAVHHEVEFTTGRIDLVGWRKGLTVTVELKLSMGLGVVEQALEHQPFTTESWVATPRRRGWNGEKTVNRLGLGWLVVAPDLKSVRARQPALANLAVDVSALAKALHPEQCEGIVAGSNRGGHSTAFKRTVARVVPYVQARPDGVTCKQVCSDVETHWPSRKPDVLARSVQTSPELWTGIRIEGRGRYARLIPIAPGVF